MAASTTILTASCMAMARMANGEWRMVGHLRLAIRHSPMSFHLELNPVLHADDGPFAGIPAVDAVVLACAEVVVLGPLDGAAAQALGVDLEVGHSRRQLLARRRTRRLQRRLDHHACDPAFRHL